MVKNYGNCHIHSTVIPLIDQLIIAAPLCACRDTWLEAGKENGVDVDVDGAVIALVNLLSIPYTSYSLSWWHDSEYHLQC